MSDYTIEISTRMKIDEKIRGLGGNIHLGLFDGSSGH
jgi:hypothetical protein